MSKSWFGVHKFWGWYPVTWEGYTLIGLMISALGLIIVTSDINSRSVSDTLLRIFPPSALVVTVTIFIASFTGAKPEFGKKERTNYSPDNPKAYLILPFLVVPFIFYYLFLGQIVDGSILGIVFILLFGVYQNLVHK